MFNSFEYSFIEYLLYGGMILEAKPEMFLPSFVIYSMDQDIAVKLEKNQWTEELLNTITVVAHRVKPVSGQGHLHPMSDLCIESSSLCF